MVFFSQTRQGGSYEGRRGHAKGYKRYPVEVVEELEVDITEFSPKNGIAKVQGLVVYVPKAKPGNHVKKRYCRLMGKPPKERSQVKQSLEA